MIRKLYIKIRSFYFLYIKGYRCKDKGPKFNDFLAVHLSVPAMERIIRNKRILKGLNNIHNKILKRKMRVK